MTFVYVIFIIDFVFGNDPKIFYSPNRRISISYFLECFTKKYVCFEGRARRAEYWFFTLFNGLIAFLLVFGTAMASGNPAIAQMVGNIWMLIALLPGVSVFIRRLHDTNRTGANFFWIFLPVIGAIILLVFMVTDGTRGPNKYGESPKA